jgi:hypothetical protein
MEVFMVSTELKKWRQLRDKINKMRAADRAKILPRIEALLEEERPSLTLSQTINAVKRLKSKLEQPDTFLPEEFSLAGDLTAWHEARQFEQSYLKRTERR